MNGLRLSSTLVLLVLAAGCGGAHTGTPAASTPTSSGATPPTTTASTSQAAETTGPGALTAEAQSAAAGDIPDNQVFLQFTNRHAGYSIRYPEGWLQRGAADAVTFADKNNLIRIVVSPGAHFTAASVRADVRALAAGATTVGAPHVKRVSLPSGRAYEVSYTTRSAPNPLTNKRVTLAVNRFYISRGAKHAVIDLGAPQGVDNVDAYRLIIQSFRWR
jgi:hypothetical protein